MDIRLDGKILLVTGSTQGVGLAIALEAARSGADGVLVTGRDSERGRHALEQCEALGIEAGFLSCELSDEDAPARVFDACLERFGRVDLLVNAAGLTDRAGVADAEVALWNRLFAVNVRAPFFLMQAFVKHLKQRSAEGAAVNILSMNIHGGTPALAVYSSSKGALAVATKNAAQAHRFDRIRFNGINMGWADTPAERTMQGVVLGGGPDWLAEAAAKQPFGRLLVADDVARLAAFLLSDASVPMTGALIDQEQWVVGAKDA